MICIHGLNHPCQKCHRGPHQVGCNLQFRERVRDGCNCQLMLDYADQLEREGRPIPELARLLRNGGRTLSVQDRNHLDNQQEK